MNYLSKRIRKLRFKPKPAPELPAQQNQPFEFCVALTNLSPDLTLDQFASIITPEVPAKLLSYLHQPDLAQPAFHALLNILKVASSFGDHIAAHFRQLGLIQTLTTYQLNAGTILPYLSLAIELFETWELPQLEALYLHLLPLLLELLNKPPSDDALCEGLNLLQVLSEIVPQFNFQPFREVFKQLFSTEKIQHMNFAMQQRVKSLLLITLLNVGYFDQGLLDFLGEMLRIDIISELDNIEGLLTKQLALIMEEEDGMKPDERLVATLGIWKNTGQAIVQCLFYLARIYEQDDFEDEDDDEEEIGKHQKPQQGSQFANKERFPIFFSSQQLISSLMECIVKNYFNFSVFIDKKLFEQGATFSDELLNIGATVFNLSTSVLNQLIQLQPIPLNESLLAQIDAIVKDTLLSDDFKQDLFKSYFQLLIRILTKATPQQIQQIPEQWPLQLSERTTSEEHVFHILELMKLRYSSKIVNSIQIIDQVTQYLMQLMNKQNKVIIAQALDCLFDIYTEEDYNEILVKRDLINLLSKGHSYLQQTLSQERKQLQKQMAREDFSFYKLTILNLGRFIEYKINVLKKM